MPAMHCSRCGIASLLLDHLSILGLGPYRIQSQEVGDDDDVKAACGSHSIIKTAVDRAKPWVLLAPRVGYFSEGLV